VTSYLQHVQAHSDVRRNQMCRPGSPPAEIEPVNLWVMSYIPGVSRCTHVSKVQVNRLHVFHRLRPVALIWG
jgi:hypothetical protein